MAAAGYIHVQVGEEDIDLTLLAEVDVSQKLNEHWSARVTLRSTPDAEPDVASLLGQPMVVTGYDLGGAQHTLFSGIVKDATLIYEVSGSFGAELRAVSQSWLIDLDPHYAYFLKQPANATAQNVAGNSGLTLGGTIDGAELSRVQWEETDWRFLLRLADDGEAWLRPTDDGIEAQASFGPGPTLEWRQGEYGLLEFSGSGAVSPLLQGGAHYDPVVMQSQVHGGVKSAAAQYGPWSELRSKTLAASEAVPEGSVVDRHRAATQSAYHQRLELESRRRAVHAAVCTGVSRSPEVRAGNEVTVAGVDGVADGTYGVVACQHRWTQRGYENRFTATTAKRWFSAERPETPQADGLYPARVTANHDPHNMGRVQVQFHWQTANATTWARLVTGHAGADRGTLLLPEVGDEVAVRFEEGDPERLYVLGSIWNGVQQPPTQGFWEPGAANAGEFALNNIKRLVTKSGHRVSLVDTPGQETIAAATPKSNRLMMTETANETGRPAVLLHTDGDIVFAAPQGRIHLQSALFSREVGEGGSGADAGSAETQPMFIEAAYHPQLGVLPVPVPVSSPDSQYDGCLIGKGCEPLTQKKQPEERLSDAEIKGAWSSAYHSNSSCCQARRAAGQAPKRIVYVNGIRTNKAAQCMTLQRIANQTCAEVLGVHNATEGGWNDLLQSKGDRDLINRARAGRPFATHDGRNPAVDSMDDVIYDSVRDGNPPEIWAHSQGGAIASLASYQSNLELKQRGYSQGVNNLQVRSFASAGQSWPPNISGQHFINVQDAVPMETGLGGDPSWDADHTGPNQKVIRFQGAPGAQDPTILSTAKLHEMNEITPTGEGGFISDMPQEGLSQYHDINTTYLNAARKVNGGCSPDGN